MTHLGTVEGQGTLFTSDGELSEMNYSISIREHEGSNDGQGTLSADSETLYAAAEETFCTLELEDGSAVDVIVADYSSDGTVRIITTGPVPDF